MYERRATAFNYTVQDGVHKKDCSGSSNTKAFEFKILKTIQSYRLCLRKEELHYHLYFFDNDVIRRLKQLHKRQCEYNGCRKTHNCHGEEYNSCKA